LPAGTVHWSEEASQSDELFTLRETMNEYRTAGLRLGWLILPALTRVEIYTPLELQVLDAPESLSADPVLPGFTLQLASIWSPPF
jgi:Uma2 family endonuclease